MSAKEPVLLVVFIETGSLRWYVAGIGLNGEAIPLMCSEPGNLMPYVGILFEEQVSFLRHRLSGVLQRGCDRIWARQKKPCQIVFLADGEFIQAKANLTRAVAEHFVVWMTNPPVAFFVRHAAFESRERGGLELIAGDIDASFRQALDAGLPKLFVATQHPGDWELAPTKKPAAE